jgi:hypothetical protein
MALTPQQRYELGLDDAPPLTVQESEFIPAGRAPRVQEPRPNPRLTLPVGDRATAPRIRAMVNELLAGNMQEADLALKRLMELNPKEGLKAYTELMSFSMPQLKAMAVAVDDQSSKPGALSFQQLVSFVQDGMAAAAQAPGRPADSQDPQDPST